MAQIREALNFLIVHAGTDFTDLADEALRLEIIQIALGGGVTLLDNS